MIRRDDGTEVDKDIRVRCSHCKVLRQHGKGCWPEEEEVPHATPFECISGLAARVEDLEQRLDRHNF